MNLAWSPEAEKRLLGQIDEEESETDENNLDMIDSDIDHDDENINPLTPWVRQEPKFLLSPAVTDHYKGQFHSDQKESFAGFGTFSHALQELSNFENRIRVPGDQIKPFGDQYSQF